MKTTAFKKLLATLSVFTFGTAVQAYMHTEPAKAQAPISEVELACERALNANTIEALEYFLNRYPPSEYSEGTTCYAMALDAYQQYGPQDEHRDFGNNNDKINRGPYGT